MNKLSDYEVKNVKTFQGHDGMGFNADLCCKGIKIAFVIDTAYGGDYEYHWENSGNREYDVKNVRYERDDNGGAEKLVSNIYKGTKGEKDFQDMINELPDNKSKLAGSDFIMRPDMDIVVSDLVDEFEINKTYKRRCKNNTLIRLKGDNEGSYREYKKTQYTTEFAANLRKSYGDKLSEIINERFL